KENQKMVEGFKYEFSLQPNGLRNNDALLARFIENRYRNSVKKMARIVVCSMFHAESTEFAVRENCRAMGLKINKGGLDFQLKNIILSIFGISLAVLMSAYVAAIAYYVVNWPPVSLHDMLTQNTKLFLTWS